jgi:hypothetical protein
MFFNVYSPIDLTEIHLLSFSDKREMSHVHFAFGKKIDKIITHKLFN